MESLKTDDIKDAQDKDVEEKLDKLQCPFTWEMDDIDKSLHTEYKPHDEEEYIPLLKLMRIIMCVYVQTKEGEELDDILENLEQSYDIIVQLKEQENSQSLVDAVHHVVQATLCHAYWKFDKKERARQILKEITNINFANKIERSTINACRSIGWSKYHSLGSEEAVDFIRKALIDDPERDLWHFILAKNLRRMRRDLSVGAIPSDEESEAFLKAYQKSRNQVFGIFVAQMYREKRMNEKAIKMYQEIFHSKPTSYTIYLRLALGFIQLFKMPLAKKCLDEVAIKYPDDCMYLHYRGIYYMKTKQFTLATHYLKRAADKDNYPASKDYLRCMRKINKSYDATQYLLSLVDKFKALPEKQIQSLLVETAISYLEKMDIKNSLKFFLHGIEVDPKSQALLEHYSIFYPGKSQNIYDLFGMKIFPLVERQKASLDEPTLELIDELKHYYEENLKNQIQFTHKVFSKLST